MSRPYWKARHVDTRALLPAKLDRGRAYFVDDEQIIIIDHGTGPVEYGGKPGPQGQAGEPIPSLQGQIDELAEASLRTSITLMEINQRRKSDAENLKSILQDISEMVQQSDSNTASAILALINLINSQEQKRDSEIAIITKAIAALYPDTHTGHAGDDSSNTTTGEIITASDGNSYLIEKSYSDNGTGIIVLSFYEPSTTRRISTLKEGDIVTVDNTSYTVIDTDGNSSNGSIILTLYEA